MVILTAGFVDANFGGKSKQEASTGPWNKANSQVNQ